MADIDRRTTDASQAPAGMPAAAGNLNDTWDTVDTYWADNFTSRPYGIGGNVMYERFRPAFRYGWESARHNVGRSWDEAEPDLRRGWDRYEHRGDHQSTWDDIKDAVKDAWDRTIHGR